MAQRWWTRGGWALGALLLGVGVAGSVGTRLAGRPPPWAAAGRAREFDPAIRAAARTWMPPGWDWRILKAMVRQESQFHAGARSTAGARGLTQVLPATGRLYGVPSWRLGDPEENLDLGARYLRALWEEWGAVSDAAPDCQRSRFAIAAYNAGPTRLRQAWLDAGRPASWEAVAPLMPLETQRHIRQVFDVYLPSYRARARGQFQGWDNGMRRALRPQARG